MAVYHHEKCWDGVSFLVALFSQDSIDGADRQTSTRKTDLLSVLLVADECHSRRRTQW
jgi:hypothetical protein